MANQRILGPPSLLKVAYEIARSPLIMATALKNFYTSKVEKIRAGFSHPTKDVAKGPRQILVAINFNQTFSLRQVSHVQLGKTTRNMRPTKVSEVEGISMKLIKGNLMCLEPALHNIISQSIATNIFPSSLKASCVNPPPEIWHLISIRLVCFIQASLYPELYLKNDGESSVQSAG